MAHYHCRACLNRTGECVDTESNWAWKYRCLACGYVWFRGVPSKRDSQRKRVYNAENAVFSRQGR